MFLDWLKSPSLKKVETHSEAQGRRVTAPKDRACMHCGEGKADNSKTLHDCACGNAFHSACAREEGHKDRSRCLDCAKANK